MTMQQQKHERESMDVIVGRNVHMLMWDRHMTQAEMGAVLGLEQSALGRKLRGRRGWSLDEVANAAEFFGVSMGELCTPRDLNPEPTDSGSGTLAPVTPIDFAFELRNPAERAA